MPCGEGTTNRAALFGSNRDVLQVRFGAAQSAGGSNVLSKRCVNSTGLCTDQLRQSIDVGVLQFGGLAILQDLGSDIVIDRQLC